MIGTLLCLALLAILAAGVGQVRGPRADALAVTLQHPGLCLIGAVILASVIAMGALFPSIFTLLGLGSLPAFGALVLAGFRPGLLARHARWGYYAVACVLACLLVWAFGVAWVAFLCKAVGDCL